MTIELDNGITYEAKVMATGFSPNGNYLLIEMKNDQPMNTLISDFSGVNVITQTTSYEPGVKKIYEGYSLFAGIRIKHSEGVVQIRLERGE